MSPKATYGQHFREPVTVLEVGRNTVRVMEVVGFSARGGGFFVPASEEAFDQINSHQTYHFNQEALDTLESLEKARDAIDAAWESVRKSLVRVSPEGR